MKSNKCDPECINGFCNNGECLCLQGYTGNSCESKVMDIINLRWYEKHLTLAFVIVSLIIDFILGIVAGYLLYLCVKGCKKDNSNEPEQYISKDNIIQINKEK